MASQFPGDRPTPITPPPPVPPLGSGPGPDASGLIARVRNIVTTPKTEWPRIAATPMTEQGIYMGVVLPLAAIPVLARLIGSLAFPPQLFGVIVRTSVAGAVTGAVIGYAISVVSVFIMAYIVAMLAPQFGGHNDRVAATKLIAFASAPVWIAGITYILPMLGGLVTLIAGIYSIYLLYLGLPVLMRSQPDKTVVYLLLTVAVAIGVFLLLGIVSGIVLAAVTPAATFGTVTAS